MLYAMGKYGGHVAHRFARGVAYGRQDLVDPSFLRKMDGLQAYYDALVASSLTVDSLNRTNVMADLSGNSAVMGLVLNGSANNAATAPDAAPVRITGSIDLRAWVMMTNWQTTATSAIFIAKDSAAGNRAYLFWIETDHKLYFRYSTDGTTVRTAASSVIAPFADFATGWVRTTYDSATGSVIFYTSTDGVTWTQLGTTQTLTAGAIFNSTAGIGLGMQSDHVSSTGFIGIIYRAQIYSGIAGTLAFDPNFTLQARAATSFVESSANGATVTVNTSGATGARIGGARDLYQGTVANQPVSLPWLGTNYGWLPGSAANYFSNASVDNPTDFDIIARVSAADWTPSVSATIAVIGNSLGKERGWFYVSTDGKLNCLVNDDHTATSSVAPTVVDGASLWIRFRYVFDTGAGNDLGRFYTCADQQAVPTIGQWVQLGTDRIIAKGTAVTPIAAAGIGYRVAVSGNNWTGVIYRVQIYNGPADTTGTLLRDFNPAATTDGATSWVASTGETWTVNQSGGQRALIVGQSSILFDGSTFTFKTAPWAVSTPVTVVVVGRQLSWTASRYLLEGGASSSMAIQQITGSPTLRLVSNGGSSGFSAMTLGTLVVLQVVFDGLSSNMRVNLAAAVATATSGSAVPNGLAVCGDINGNFQGNFQINAIAVFSGTLTAAGLERLVIYCGRRYRIAV